MFTPTDSRRAWSGRRSRRWRIALVVAALAVLMPDFGAPVHAGPDRARVIRGDVVFRQRGNLYVIRASDGAIINFRNLSIKDYETLKFIQPGPNARVLNRVTGEAFTRIDGTLLSNGIVYIVNPAGIYFGRGAVVDVGGLYAAAGDLSNSRFLRGVDRFTNLRGDVDNRGAMTGDALHLIGQHVANRGTITSERGIITMLAGNDVLIQPQGERLKVKIDGKRVTDRSEPVFGATRPDLEGRHAGVENRGTVSAPRGRLMVGAGDLYSLGINNRSVMRADGGHVTVAATDGAVLNRGTISASVERGRAGTVVVQGPSVVNDGTISADADAGRAGTVEVTGRNHAYLLEGSRVSAAGRGGAARGGSVRVRSTHGTTIFSKHALADVSGGRAGGRGGEVELGGRHVVYSGEARVRGRGTARHGRLVLTLRDLAVDETGGGAVALARTDVTFDELRDLDGVDLIIDDNGLNAFVGDLWLNAERDLAIRAALDLVSREVLLTAGRHVILEAPIFAAGNLTARADATGSAGRHGSDGIGDLRAHGTLDVDGRLSLRGSTVVAWDDLLGAAVAIEGPAVLRGVRQTVRARDGALRMTDEITITRHGDLTLAAADRIDLDDDLVHRRTGDVSLIAPVIRVTGDLRTTDGALTLTGTTRFDGAKQTVRADGGGLYFDGAVRKTGAGRLALRTSEVLDVDGDLVHGAAGNVTLAGTGGIELAGDANTKKGNLTFEGHLTLDGADQAVTAGRGTLRLESGVDKTSAGALTLAADKRLELTGDARTTDGDLVFDGDVTLLDGARSDGDTKMITAGDGGRLVFTGDVTATGSRHLALSAGDTIDVDGNVRHDGSGDLLLAAARIELGGDAAAAQGDLALEGDTFVDGNAQTLAAGGSLHVDGDVTKTAAGDLALRAGARLDLDGDLRHDAAGDATLRGAGIELAGNAATHEGTLTFDGPALFDGGTQRVQARGGALRFNDDLEKAGGERLTLASDRTVRLAGDARAPGRTLVFEGATRFDGAGGQSVRARTIRADSDLIKVTRGDLTLAADEAIELDGSTTQLLAARRGRLRSTGRIEKLSGGDLKLAAQRGVVLGHGSLQITREGDLRVLDQLRLEGDYLIETDGRQVYMRAVTLERDGNFIMITHASRPDPCGTDHTADIEFHSRLDGAADLAIVAFFNTDRHGLKVTGPGGRIRFHNAVGKRQALGSLLIDGANVIDFQTSWVEAIGDIRLNPRGREQRSSFNLVIRVGPYRFQFKLEFKPRLELRGATMFRDHGNLNIVSRQGDVVMGIAEKLTVNGNLRILAPNGTAAISDLNTRHNMTVLAREVRYVLRPPIEQNNCEGGTYRDAGLDFVAVGTDITIRGDGVASTLGFGAPPRAGTSDAQNIEVESLPGVVTIATTSVGNELGNRGFEFDGTLVDFATGNGVSSTNPAGAPGHRVRGRGKNGTGGDGGSGSGGADGRALATEPEVMAMAGAPVPGAGGEPADATDNSAGQVATMLARLGIVPRPPRPALTARLAGAKRIHNDLFQAFNKDGALQIDVARLDADSLRRAAAAYETLFEPPAADGTPRPSARDVLGRAWEQFREDAIAGRGVTPRETGAAFARHAAQADADGAGRVVTALRSFNTALTTAGLSTSERADIERKLLNAIKPDQMDLETLRALVDA